MPENKKYDIFINYRRKDGKQYAKILQLELEKRGFSVFLDYDELEDGVFGDSIKEAIASAPVFIIVLTNHYLERSMMPNSWIWEEVKRAIDLKKHIIPVNPDGVYDGIIPEGTPEGLVRIIQEIQHSTIDFGELFRESMGKMVSKRILPFVQPKKKRKSLLWTVLAALTILLAVGGYLFLRQQAINKLKIQEAPNGQRIIWDNAISLREIRAVNDILGTMKAVKGGTLSQGAGVGEESPLGEAIQVEPFLMGKYEVTRGEWHAIMGGRCNKEEADLPVENVSFDQCVAFCENLYSLTKLSFRLPTEAEWEFAAKGGDRYQGTLYAGSDNPGEVAWYRANSGDVSHPRDIGRRELTHNSQDLYDMSGNVYEWCDTDFEPYPDPVTGEVLLVPDPDSKVIRGGCYLSELFEITVLYREPMNAHEPAPTIGFRLAL